MAIVVALKFKCHLGEVSLEGTRLLLQHIQNNFDWADDDFFEPNNQGLSSTKNGCSECTKQTPMISGIGDWCFLVM